MECTRWHKNQQAYLEVIWKENKTDDVICLHFGVYGNICGHMIPSSQNRTVSLFIQVEHTYTVYFHNLGELQITGLSPFIGFRAF